jgi:hypothetical protein
VYSKTARSLASCLSSSSDLYLSLWPSTQCSTKSLYLYYGADLVDEIWGSDWRMEWNRRLSIKSVRTKVRSNVAQTCGNSYLATNRLKPRHE